MKKEQIADHIAHSAFQGLGLEMNAESIANSFLGIAWTMGLPKLTGGWSAVSIRYHYEETLALRFLAVEAEALAGYLTKLMTLTERELGLPVAASGLVPLDILKAMTRWSRAHALHRAHVAGSLGELSVDEAESIYNSRVMQYQSFISASVSNKLPIPARDFQLGLSRDHPWTAIVCFMSDNICESLKIEKNGPEARILQLAIDLKRRSFYESILQNLG